MGSKVIFRYDWPIKPQNLCPWLVKSSQSNFNLRSPDCYSVRNYYCMVKILTIDKVIQRLLKPFTFYTKYLYKGLVFWRNSGWLMDGKLTVPIWVPINWPKIPQMSQNLPIQIVPNWDFDEKRFHWVSVVRVWNQMIER